MSRGRVALVGLVGLTACADPWEEARSACDLDEPLPWDAPMAAADGLNGLSVSTTCGETLLGQLGGDAGALLRDIDADPDLGTHIEAVRTNARPTDGVTTVVWGLLWLAGADYGAIGDLEVGPYVSQAWLDRANAGAERLGLSPEDPLAHVLYDDVVTRTAGISFLPDDAPFNAPMGMRSWPSDSLHVSRALDHDVAWVIDPWIPDSVASGLYHEAWHANLDGLHHVDCEAPAREEGRNCDADLDGPYGAAFLALWAEATAARDGATCIPREWSIEDEIAARAELEIRVTWPEMLMTELPGEPLGYCE